MIVKGLALVYMQVFFQQIHNLCLFEFRIVQKLINVCFALTPDDAIKREKNETSRCKQEQRKQNLCGDGLCENVHCFDSC